MPKLNPSPGKITIQTPFQDEFQRWLCYELQNSHIVEGGMTGARRWMFETDRWTISWSGGPVVVESSEPIVFIRKGLQINMGNGRLEVV